MSDFVVTVGGHELDATWADENPKTRAAVEGALPIAGDATRWGDELYLRTDIEVGSETTTETVPEGALAYWPGGDAVCLFWGPTPASTGSQPRAAAPVNVFGRVGDVAPLDGVEGGARMRLSRP